MQPRHFLLVLVGAALGLFAGCVRRPCTSSSVVGGAVPILDAHYSVASCCGGSRYIWTGHSCEPVPAMTLCGCSCSGKDCDKVFLSREECESAYSHCG